MGLKSIVEDIDEVPESLREHYAEADGKFVLSLTDDVKTHPKVQSLQNAYERLKTERKRFLDDIKAKDYAAVIEKLKPIPEDFDIEEYERLKAGGNGDGKDQPKTDEQVARVREQLERKHATALSEIQAELEKERQINRRMLVDEGLTKSLLDAGVDKAFLRASQAMLRDLVKVVDEDGERKAIVETDMGPSPLSKYVADWTASDEGKPFVSKATGGGATGGNGRSNEPNPWHKDTRNMTEQGRIFKSDRSKAERLMRAAGMSEAEIRKRVAG